MGVQKLRLVARDKWEQTDSRCAQKRTQAPPCFLSGFHNISQSLESKMRTLRRKAFFPSDNLIASYTPQLPTRLQWRPDSSKSTLASGFRLSSLSMAFPLGVLR